MKHIFTLLGFIFISLTWQIPAQPGGRQSRPSEQAHPTPAQTRNSRPRALPSHTEEQQLLADLLPPAPALSSAVHILIPRVPPRQEQPAPSRRGQAAPTLRPPHGQPASSTPPPIRPVSLPPQATTEERCIAWALARGLLTITSHRTNRRIVYGETIYMQENEDALAFRLSTALCTHRRAPFSELRSMMFVAPRSLEQSDIRRSVGAELTQLFKWADLAVCSETGPVTDWFDHLHGTDLILLQQLYQWCKSDGIPGPDEHARLTSLSFLRHNIVHQPQRLEINVWLAEVLPPDEEDQLAAELGEIYLDDKEPSAAVRWR